MTTQYDPLRILITQNQKEREAYFSGIESGKETGKKEGLKCIFAVALGITSRIKAVHDLESKESLNKSTCKIRFLGKITKHQAYIAGLEDAMKITSKSFKKYS